MRLITCHRGRLEELFSPHLHARQLGAQEPNLFSTGLAHLDALLPGNGFPRAAIHEILSQPGQGLPLFFAMLLAKAAADPEKNSGDSPSAGDSQSAIIWCDPEKCIYPPALVAAGIHLRQLYMLHPKSQDDLVWATAECLRCRGVGAVVASPARLSRIQSRRLQLAAETGGGVGILLRPCPVTGRGGGEACRSARAQYAPAHYAAATRWLVTPSPGQRTVQRWKIQLIHCHGGNTHKTIILEHCRETNSLRSTAELAHREIAGPIAKIVGA
jgi:protein ImuA